MKKKGFTLVELLAVIVILAVISIITVPMIGNVIEDSKKKALETSVNGLVETANYFTISNDGIYEFLFNNEKHGETINGKTLDYSGKIDAEGNLYIDNNGNVSLCLMNEDYYVYKNYNSGIVVGNRKEDSCKAEYDPLTNKYIAYLESEGTGSISNVYSKEEVNNLVDGLETKIDSNSTSINAITGVVNTNKSNIETIQSELDKYALQEDLDTTNSNVSNINNQVSTNTDNISNLQTTIGNLATTSNVEAVNTLANKNKTDIASIQTQLGNMATTSNIESLNTLINQNKTNISTNTTNIANLQSAIDGKTNTIYSGTNLTPTLVYGEMVYISELQITESGYYFIHGQSGINVPSSGTYYLSIQVFATGYESQLAIKRGITGAAGGGSDISTIHYLDAGQTIKLGLYSALDQNQTIKPELNKLTAIKIL